MTKLYVIGDSFSAIEYKLLHSETTLPYPTTELRWDLADGLSEIIQTNPTIDRQYILNGVTLYVYKLQTAVNYPTAGIKNIVVKSLNPGASLCGDYDIINLNFEFIVIRFNRSTVGADVLML